MSYILEALKKAQAERQLGNAPTIHAPQAVPVAPAQAGTRTRWLTGLGIGALVVVAAGALLLMRRAPVAAPAVATAVQTAQAPAAAATVPDTLAVSAPPVQSVPAPVSMPARAAATAPANASATAAATAAVTAAATASAPASAAPTAPAAARPVAVPSSGALPAQAPVGAARAPAPVPAAADDSLPYLQQLPDAQQRDIPRVGFGGYMYSANPADRLLIVDKVLRHEGEEVAPGLVLEKLLPRAAVMNYRGTRYRVAY
jgi:general secretion pathway protein B